MIDCGSFYDLSLHDDLTHLTDGENSMIGCLILSRRPRLRRVGEMLNCDVATTRRTCRHYCDHDFTRASAMVL